MKGILINPHLRTIEMVEVNKEDVTTLYNALSWLGSKVSTIIVGGTFPNGDNLLADPSSESPKGATLGPYTFKGNAMLFGQDENREWSDPQFGLVDLQEAILWRN